MISLLIVFKSSLMTLFCLSSFNSSFKILSKLFISGDLGELLILFRFSLIILFCLILFSSSDNPLSKIRNSSDLGDLNKSKGVDGDFLLDLSILLGFDGIEEFSCS